MAEQNQKYSQFRGQPRLPKFAIPKRYDLKLKPDLAACKFAGAVQISVDVVSDTKFLVLNAAELSVNPKSVTFASANKVASCPIIDSVFVLSLDYLWSNVYRKIKFNRIKGKGCVDFKLVFSLCIKDELINIGVFDVNTCISLWGLLLWCVILVILFLILLFDSLRFRQSNVRRKSEAWVFILLDHCTIL